MKMGNTSLVTSWTASPQRAMRLAGSTVATASSWRLSRAFLAHSTTRCTRLTRTISPKTTPTAVNPKRLVRFRNAVTSADDIWRRFEANAGNCDRPVFGVGSGNVGTGSVAEDCAVLGRCGGLSNVVVSMDSREYPSACGLVSSMCLPALGSTAGYGRRVPRLARMYLSMRLSFQGDPAASRQSDARRTPGPCAWALGARGPSDAKPQRAG